jgi:type I restriction enzyme, S subunit
LPSEAWGQAALGDIAEVVVGGTPSTKEPEYWGDEIVWVTPTDITSQWGRTLSDSKRRITPLGLEKSSARLVPAGSVLVTTRATIGPSAIAACDVATNQGVTALVPSSRIDSLWLYYWVRANEQTFVALGSGNTFPEVSRKKTREITVDVPQLPEQRRIADLARSADDVTYGTSTQAIQLDRLFSAELARAFNELKRPKYTSLSELASVERGISWEKDRESQKELRGSLPIVRIGNVQPSGIDMSERLYISGVNQGQRSKRLISAHTILMVGSNGNPDRVGNAVLATPEVVGSGFASFLIGITAVNPDFSRFLWRFLQGPSVQRAITQATAGSTGLKNLSLKWLRSMQVPVPAAGEMAKLVERMDAIEGATEATRSMNKRASTLGRGLVQALYDGRHRIPASYDQSMPSE